jgi:hypothetical protein
MLKTKPFCFRHSTIRPNLNCNSVCVLLCQFKDDCIRENYDDLEYEIELSDIVIKEVIEKLEKVATSLESFEPIARTKLEIKSFNNMKSRAFNIRLAIELLRDE